MVKFSTLFSPAPCCFYLLAVAGRFVHGLPPQSLLLPVSRGPGLHLKRLRGQFLSPLARGFVCSPPPPTPAVLIITLGVGCELMIPIGAHLYIGLQVALDMLNPALPRRRRRIC